jgi:hypothetical protein
MLLLFLDYGKTILMLKSGARKKAILLSIVIACVLLNLYTFLQAYPETLAIDSGLSGGQILAKDFSAYYIGAWRLFHDPSNVYTKEFVSDGEPFIYPQPEPYKYLPSFLMFVAPSLLLSYQDALIAFDIAQFLLLPVMAFLVYELLKERSTLTIAIVIVLSILQPWPTPHWGLSVSYFWQWGEGQDKVINTALLLLSFYLGKTRKPILSGAVLGLGAFDPRFFLLSLPLFAVYNRLDLKKSCLSLAASLVVFNFPLLIDGIGAGFLQMAVQRGVGTPLYYYALIPFLTLVSLIVLNAKEIYLLFRALLSRVAEYSRNSKSESLKLSTPLANKVSP